MPKLTNIRRGNTYSQGGLVSIIAFRTFMANGVTPAATYTPDVADDKLISAIALDPSVVPVVLEAEIDKANFTDNLTVGAGRYIAQSLGMTLAGLDSAKNKAVEDLDLVQHTFVVKDRRGNCFLLGQLNGLIASQNNAGSGSAAGDLNGFEIVVNGAENGRAPQVALAAFATLTTLVAP